MSTSLTQRLDLEGWLTGLESLPIGQQFRLVDFSPRIDEPLLRPWQAAADQFDGAMLNTAAASW